MVDLQEKLAARDTVARCIIEYFFATLAPSLTFLAAKFCASRNESVNVALRVGSNTFQFHADTTVDGISLTFSGDAASENGRRSTKGGDVADPPVDPEVIRF